MNAAEVVVEGIEVDTGEWTYPKENGRTINEEQAEASEVEIVDAATLETIFFNGTRDIQTIWANYVQDDAFIERCEVEILEEEERSDHPPHLCHIDIYFPFEDELERKVHVVAVKNLGVGE